MTQISLNREKMLKLFTEVMEKNNDWDTVDETIASVTIVDIESSCLKYAKEIAESQNINSDLNNNEFAQIYSASCYRILAALQPELDGDTQKPSYIYDCVLDDKICLDSIAYMKNEDLYPNSGRAEREDIKLRQQQKINPKVSNFYICPKCKQRGARLIEYQGRAADELSTIRKQCIHCNSTY